MNPGHALVPALAILVVLMGSTDPVAGKTKKVSDYFTLCHRSDPDLSGCVKRSMEASKESIVKGIPELKLPPVDPLYIPAMELREGQGNFLFILKMKNLSITGLKDYTIDNVKVDLKGKSWELDMSIPHLHFEAEYEMQGRILALPIQGKGDSVFDFEDVKTKALVEYEYKTRDGKTYARIGDLKWILDVGGATSNFTNLFNGEKTLGETTNRFLNENWKDAFETYKHLPEEAFAEFFRDLENRFYDQFSVDELYPE